MAYYLLALVILALDQWTKYLVIQKMHMGESIPIIEGVFYFTSARNTGAAWGILEGQMWFFYIITLVVLVAIVYYMQRFGWYQPILGIALGLVLGGAIGNFIDRLFRGAVVDFIHVYIGSYSYPIFNIADSALVVGAIIICIFTFLDGKKEKANETHGTDGTAGDSRTSD